MARALGTLGRYVVILGGAVYLVEIMKNKPGPYTEETGRQSSSQVAGLSRQWCYRGWIRAPACSAHCQYIEKFKICGACPAPFTGIEL
jgi:hypothetical protein